MITQLQKIEIQFGIQKNWCIRVGMRKMFNKIVGNHILVLFNSICFSFNTTIFLDLIFIWNFLKFSYYSTPFVFISFSFLDGQQMYLKSSQKQLCQNKYLEIKCLFTFINTTVHSSRDSCDGSFK